MTLVPSVIAWVNKTSCILRHNVTNRWRSSITSGTKRKCSFPLCKRTLHNALNESTWNTMYTNSNTSSSLSTWYQTQCTPTAPRTDIFLTWNPSFAPCWEVPCRFFHQHHPVSAAVQEDEYLKEIDWRPVNAVSKQHYDLTTDLAVWKKLAQHA